ncbi:DDE_Tnp_IS1595 domain-containing protein [Trichonephila clavata]|uniref:DDE_Tnp_IS1595 domain-containing protein n=1 Tax=Trichonephila clavata TaxID=2740835 RepID=A0A8X6HR65_TRICU|nr:DDE_Tnp_IS1595 domain-containing protein [Trichonephila clavata]
MNFPTSLIKLQWFFGTNTIFDWGIFINEVILGFVEESTKEIDGVGKIVQIVESKFGKRKYNRGHHVEGQCVFGGVERESGKLCLVAVHDQRKRY